jgi:phosphoserine phosphatase
MLARADVSVAYRAKPRVRAAAVHAIDHSGLDAVLNLFA